MPAHNEALYIGRAIESVLAQTFTDFEFLVLNDSSSDETGEIIKKYAASDKRVKYLEGKGTGVADARNILQREAKGRFLVNADADDYCKPERLEKLRYLALRLGEPCLVGSNFDFYINDAFVRVETFPTKHEDIKKRLAKTFNRYAISANQLLGTAQLFKSNPVQNKFKIMSDWDQFLRIQENQKVRLGNVNESLYIYYVNSGSMSIRKYERSLYSAFLRDCEIRRLRGEEEFSNIHEYLRSFWKKPTSLFLNSFFIGTKYIQQFIDY